jgi:hypothetical protein
MCIENPCVGGSIPPQATSVYAPQRPFRVLGRFYISARFSTKPAFSSTLPRRVGSWKMSVPTTQGKDAKPTRDWFGYILTAVIGVLITVGATWYQIYVSERQATAAELERSRAVRQSVISIVEEQALNGKKLEAERIARLIDQRRREQNVSIPVSTADAVQQAEFNISSSTYLSIERKEQIKPVFDSFYADLVSRSFTVFAPSTPNAELLNGLAKQIQEGRTTDALASVRRLQELHSEDLAKVAQKAKPSFLEAFIAFFKKPLNAVLFLLGYAALLRFAYVVRQRRKWGRYWRTMP